MKMIQKLTTKLILSDNQDDFDEFMIKQELVEELIIEILKRKLVTINKFKKNNLNEYEAIMWIVSSNELKLDDILLYADNKIFTGREVLDALKEKYPNRFNNENVK